MNLPPNEKEKYINKQKKKDNNGVNQNSDLTSNQKQINCAYCISCFHKEIWKLYTLAPANPEKISIENIYQQMLTYDKYYIVSIHKINLKEKIKKINLVLTSKNNNRSWNLNEISIKPDKEKVLFTVLELNINYLYEFLNDLIDNFNDDDNFYFDENPKISRYLKHEEKLNIYLNYFKKNKIEKEIKQNLVSQYFSTLKDDNDAIYSDIIEIFSISFGTKEIIVFLDNYTKLNYNLSISIGSNEFKDILNLYKNEPKKFFDKNKIFFKKGKITAKNKEEINPIDKYKNLLENFITIYQIFYEESSNIKEKRLINARETLITLINNKKNLINYISFIESKFDSFFKIFNLNDNEKLKINKSLIENDNEYLFEMFKGIYELIIKDQEEKGKFFLDFSQIFNYFVDTIIDINQLIKLKTIYKVELNLIPNKYFENKINEKIHSFGIKEINKGNFNNNFLIEYIKNDEFYKRENKVNTKKKFAILQFFQIDLMDDKFLEKYNREKIYSYFEDDLVFYLTIFSENIREIKKFSLFFKLLPLEKFNNDELITFLSDWIKKNFNTFSKEKCPNFNKEMEILFNLICKNNLINIAYSLIEFLKENLKEDSKELFIFLLNSLDKNSITKIIDSLIDGILFPFLNNDYNDDIINVNINLILLKLNPNKIISKAVLKKLEFYSINYEDCFKEKSPRFSIFEKLLNYKDYSLLSDDNNKNSLFWENTLHTCNSITKDLKSLNITYMKIKNTFNIIGEDNFQKRIMNIFKCINVEDYKYKTILVISNINEIVHNWDIKLKMIENIKKYNNFIYNDLTIDNEKLSLYNKKIMESLLEYLNSKKALEEFSKYEEDIKKANELSELKESNVFLKIFNKIKDYTTSRNLLEKAIKKFKNIKKIFVNNRKKIEEELKVNKEVKYLINIGYESKTILIKEIEYLLNYFNIYDFENKDYLIEKINMIVENKSLFSVVSGILYLFEGYKNILNLNNKEDNEFYIEYTNYKNLLKTKDYIPDDKINDIIINIEKKFQINFENLETKKIFFNLFVAINQSPKSIDFLQDKNSEQVNNLNEFLLESDDTSLTEKDINDYIKVVRFFEELIKNKEINKTFLNFVKTIIDGISDNNKIGGSLNNYIQKYNLIQTLFNQYLKHTEGCIKKIKNILCESNFTIELNSNKEYSLEGTYLSSCIVIENQNNNEQLEGKKGCTNNIIERHEAISYGELEYIFQRVFIAKIPEIYKENVDKYIHFFKNIKEIIILLNDLYRQGYQDIFTIVINFKDSNLTCDYENKKKITIEELMKDFSELYKNISKSLYNIYSSKEIIRFFYGRQINLIMNIIINQNKIKDCDLFKVAFNNVINVNDDYKYMLSKYNPDYLKGSVKFKALIFIMINFLEEQLTFNKLNIKDIYKKNQIKIIKKPYQNKNIENKQNKNNIKYKGIFFYLTHKNQELESLGLYFCLTKNLPINSCFLYCNKETSIEELKTFLTRCVFCEYNILFCMVNVNLLNSIIRREFLYLVKNVAHKKGKVMESCLIIIFNDKDNDIHNMLLKTKNIKAFPDTYYFSYNFTFDKDFFDSYKIELIKSTY